MNSKLLSTSEKTSKKMGWQIDLAGRQPRSGQHRQEKRRGARIRVEKRNRGVFCTQHNLGTESML